MPSNPAHVATRKSKRIAKAEQDSRLIERLHSIEKKLHKLIEHAPSNLGIETDVVRSQFLAYANVRSTALPTAWNGLVHEKLGKKYVVERIKDKELYTALLEDKVEYYRNVAQKLRDDKLNAGSAKTSCKRLFQGSAKDDIHKIGTKLDHISQLTSVQFVLLVVRGQSQDGLKPLHYASNQARTFLEGYLSVPMSQLLTMMEMSAIGGASALVNRNQIEGSRAKAEVRQVLLKQLRDTATSTARDGSAPTITNANSIHFVEWKNYYKIVKNYKVEVF
ncbi:hypothetical protein FRC10_005203, partial [Ceratobasidium sp. 414]